MCTKECVSKLFVNLKVIAQAKEGQKICTNGTHLTLVEGDQWRTSVSRWWTSDSRQQTMASLEINIEHATEFCHRAIASEILQMRCATMNEEERKILNQTLNNLDVFITRDILPHTLRLGNEDLLDCLLRELSQVNDGLTNLQKTYHDDTLMEARIQLLKESVTRQTNSIEQHNAAKKHTTKENVDHKEKNVIMHQLPL